MAAGTFEKVPCEQGTQTDNDVPATMDELVPIGQGVHYACQCNTILQTCDDPVDVLNVPATHGKHCELDPLLAE